MTARITQQQLESYLWGAATLLRGTIDAGDYKQFIFPLLFYKRLCDVFDEETKDALAESGGDAEFAAYPENHRFQIPPEAHWRKVRQVAREVGREIQSAMRAIETANPDKLFGIFGDAQWTNKDRLPDSMLRDLIEHFSSLDLSIANLPEDELGQGYEYLIKKFADDSGHTAAEFYTNRTVVHLMTEMLVPQPGESIYDPTCGSGGMLLSCIAHLRQHGREWRNVKLYGQERNLMTSSIARMNCFLHGIEDFQIVRGDTLSDPKFVQGDRLMRFDLVLANPPYSIKQWDRSAFASDKWGRNLYGTPPQGRADYAFWQHILASLDPNTGRCAILFPHGVLFRQEEAEMRRKLVDADLIECVLGLGPNLFYNSPMEACIAICRTSKPKDRKGKILFINAVNEVTRERAQSFLTGEHIGRIAAAYRNFRDKPGFCRSVPVEEIRSRNGSLSIPLFVDVLNGNGNNTVNGTGALAEALNEWLESREDLREAITRVLPGAMLGTSEDKLRGKNTCDLIKGRAQWQRVRFGDVVENLNETERNPEDAGIERFIGLEHLEPGSLYIRSWGNVADGTTFTRLCRPGQVLFGKRRAYQRKVAVAEFEAVVSGDIYVLTPKNDRLVPELLPFICMSEQFFQHAVGTSAGSLSPRTNWRSLAGFEFDLPSLDQQRRIAEILLSIDQAQVNWAETLDHFDRALSAFTSSATMGKQKRGPTQESPIGPLPKSWSCYSIAEMTTHSAYGPRFPSSSYSEEGNAYQIRTTDFDRLGGINFSQVPGAQLSEEVVAQHILATGDFLLSRSGEYAGLTALYSDPLDGRAYIPGAFLIRFRFCRLLEPEFVLYLCNSEFGNRYVKPLATGSAQPNISGTAFSRLFIPVPPIQEQRSIIQEVSHFQSTRRCLRDRYPNCVLLRDVLINTFIG